MPREVELAPPAAGLGSRHTHHLPLTGRSTPPRWLPRPVPPSVFLNTVSGVIMPRPSPLCRHLFGPGRGRGNRPDRRGTIICCRNARLSASRGPERPEVYTGTAKGAGEVPPIGPSPQGREGEHRGRLALEAGGVIPVESTRTEFSGVTTLPPNRRNAAETTPGGGVPACALRACIGRGLPVTLSRSHDSTEDNSWQESEPLGT